MRVFVKSQSDAPAFAFSSRINDVFRGLNLPFAESVFIELHPPKLVPAAATVMIFSAARRERFSRADFNVFFLLIWVSLKTTSNLKGSQENNICKVTTSK